MMSQIWDKKSKNYPRFSKNLSVFNEAVLINLTDFGVDFKDKSVVDIGCGTGVWTLYLAGLCAEILGVDSSAGMIKCLDDDAKIYSIKNVKTQISTWADFIPQKHYDIAISTMSPAIKSPSDFAKFYDMASVRIYMNFASSRRSSLLKPFFEKFGVFGASGSASNSLLAWLNEREIPFKKVTFGESRISKRDRVSTLENILWHLDINGVKYDKNEILTMLDENFSGEIIEEKIDSLISLFVF